MYSKVYTITCDDGHNDALMSHYDDVVAPAIRESAHHVGQQMVEVGDNEWILVSNYTSGEAADAASDMVRALVGDMSAKFGMKLSLIGHGEVSRQVT
jgi:hypothetical protein